MGSMSIDFHQSMLDISHPVKPAKLEGLLRLARLVSYLSIWIDSKSMVWDSSVVFTDNSY